MLFVAAPARVVRTALVATVTAVRSMFGYDASEKAANGKRRAPSRDMRYEDGVLRTGRRVDVQSSARDAARNFSVASWMTRAHVNYVTRHRFQMVTGNDEFDLDVEKLIAKKSEAEHFDISGRFCLSEFVAMTERAAFLDGDLLWVKLGSGHIQPIESDLIQDTKVEDGEEIVNGVVLDPKRPNRPAKYAVHYRPRKQLTGYKFDRFVPAANAWLHGYIERFEQTRGVSPLTSALLALKDVYEGIDLSLAKLKAEALFGIKFTRSGTEAVGTVLPSASTGGDEEESQAAAPPRVDFGLGPIQLDLEKDEDAEFMRMESPGTQAQEFLRLVIMVVLKAADMPYSFFDEGYTNFYGSRAGWLRYDDACVPKRERVQKLLNAWTLWRLLLCVQDGELQVPEGITLSTDCWVWIPEGSTWWDPVKDVEGDKSAVMAGFADAEDIARKRRGGDIWKNIEKNGRIIRHAEKNGVPLSWAPVPQTINVVEADPKEENPRNAK